MQKGGEVIVIAEEQIVEETKDTLPDIEAVVLSDKQKVYLFFKRVFDIAVSLVAVPVLVLPMALIAVMIKLESPGPVIFKQQRMGKGGKVFTIYKFRTMCTAAPSEVAARTFADSQRYITRLGAFLRRTSIDELPQLYNILRGDMSLVGYRPLCLVETLPNEMRMRCGVFALRPGITGLAQVSGRDRIDDEEKVRLDAKYAAKCSLKMDLYCLLKTVTTVFSGEGVL